MANSSDDDLKFLLTIDPDTAAVEQALANIVKDMDLASKAMVAGMSRAGREQQQTLDGTAKTAELFKQLGAWSNQIAEAEEVADQGILARHAAMQDITKELERQREHLIAIQAAQDPETLRERVRLEREIAEEKKKLQAAEAKEKHEQERPGFFQRLFQDPQGSMANIGESIKSVFAGIKEEFSKGGIGGVIDSFLAGAKGGGGAGKSDLFGAMMSGADAGELAGIVGATGPIGLAIAAIPMVSKALGSLASAPMAAIARGLSTVSTALSGLQGPLGPISAGLNLASAALQYVANNVKSIPIIGEVLGPFFDQLARIPGLIGDILNSLTSFAAKASPGQFKMFQMAIEDVQGVIGQSFLPVLELMRDAIRFVGDALATILPSMTEVRSALTLAREAFAVLGDALRDILSEIGPLIRGYLLIELHLLGVQLTTLSYIVSAALTPLRLILYPLKLLFDLIGAGARTSVGAAARQVRIEGMEEYERAFQTAAFAQPGGVSLQQQQVSWLQKIYEVLANRREGQEAEVGNSAGGRPTLGEAAGDVMRYTRQYGQAGGTYAAGRAVGRYLLGS